MDAYFENMNGAVEEHVIIATEVIYAPLLAKAGEDPSLRSF